MLRLETVMLCKVVTSVGLRLLYSVKELPLCVMLKLETVILCKVATFVW